MKATFLILCFLCLLLSGKTEAQTINPDSQWRVDYTPDLDPYDLKYLDIIDGDTIIDSIEYYKIYNSGYIYDYSNYYIFEHELHGFLREEGDKWYSYQDFRDTLLYDFSLEVGDTLIAAFTQGPIVVEAIDSILVDGEYRERMHMYLGPTQPEVNIIAGIGSTRGLFEKMKIPGEWGGGILRCYAIDGIPVYTPFYECDLTVDIHEYDKSPKSISISPNPAINYILVNLPQDLGMVHCKLMNSMGKIVFEKDFESNSVNKILTSSYDPGLYIAVFENDLVKQSIKFIIE